MKDKNIDQFILALASPVPQAASAGLREAHPQGIDADLLFAAAHRHEIIPYLYFNVCRNGLRESIPAPFLQKVGKLYFLNVKRNTILESELRRLTQAADRQDIRLMPFKGFALVHTLYRDPGARHMTDIDILVRAQDFVRAQDALKECGFSLSSDKGFELLFTKQLPEQAPVFIELHDAFCPPRPYPLRLPQLWDRAQTVAVNGTNMLFPSLEDTFISLCLHVRRHTRRLTLKFIADIAESLRAYAQTLDWEYIRRAASENRFSASIAVSLYLCEELLGIKAPGRVSRIFPLGPYKKAFLGSFARRNGFMRWNRLRGTVLRACMFDGFADIPRYFRVKTGTFKNP